MSHEHVVQVMYFHAVYMIKVHRLCAVESAIWFLVISLSKLHDITRNHIMQAKYRKYSNTMYDPI